MLEHSYVPAVPRSVADFVPSSVPLDDWHRFDRFLLGCDGGTYRVDRALVAADCLPFISRIVAISESGRVPKNDPAIFSLALAPIPPAR